MKKVLLLTTGGTIASKPGENGLSPAIGSEELLTFVPELSEICRVETMQLYHLDSTNIGPRQWVGIAEAIRERCGDYDGFVITHGTDTMAYTAAALSYLIQNPDKPIVLTGSQKSIYNRDTDARNNLLRAFLYASSDQAWGVQLVFDSKVILGTRARKVRSKSFNAFSSIDYPETAVFRDMKLIPFLPKPAYRQPPRFDTKLDEKVFLLRLLPGMNGDIFDFLIPCYNGLIIEGFGMGGLPTLDKSLLKGLERWTRSGGLTVFSTQVQHEGSDLSIYEVGRVAKALPGVLEAHDMTPEAVVTKLMWALGQAAGQAEARRLFSTPVQFDLI
ncbi:MAG: asparaginase [Oscillospiraceae bacterium]|nr:asparaginase [Oscillospiraceae bacterium]